MSPSSLNTLRTSKNSWLPSGPAILKWSKLRTFSVKTGIKRASERKRGRWELSLRTSWSLLDKWSKEVWLKNWSKVKYFWLLKICVSTWPEETKRKSRDRLSWSPKKNSTEYWGLQILKPTKTVSLFWWEKADSRPYQNIWVLSFTATLSFEKFWGKNTTKN